MRELTLLLAPNVNSYKRYAEGSFAPTTIAWDHYVHGADVELEAFESAVTDWERVRGFERL